jgi:hypothetical protein
MIYFALTGKALLAAMLIVAGGAKLADLASFTSVIRLFLTFHIPRRIAFWIAGGVAIAELALGLASVSSPAVDSANVLVFALACAFSLTSIMGYVFHRGQSCRCFGALSARQFDVMGVLRSIAIAGVAAFAMADTNSSLVRVGLAGRFLLLLGGAVLAVAAFTAARSLAQGRKLGMEMR